MKKRVSLFVFVLTAAVVVLSANNINAESSYKTIELILDASGSMNGVTSEGEIKITAAKEAVKEVVENLPDELEIAFRAYGHQSVTEKHDCEDTRLLVEFGTVKTNRSKIISSLEGLQAKGYTPITYVLNLAVNDFPERETEGGKTIILVSDGKETCEGDPCATAKELKDKQEVDLVVHTVGFGVDSVTRRQLECISKVTGGDYFSASNTDDLTEMLNKAVKTEVIVIEEKEGPGRLSILGAELQGHKVTDAETGEEVVRIDATQNTVEIPSGIYNVQIGNAQWKSVEVEADETTVLEPGRLYIKNTTLSGNKVLEAETGELFGYVSRTDDTLTILPGTYDVMFGNIPWRVSIKQGETKELYPGVVTVKSASFSGHYIYDENGEKAGCVSATSNWMPLPPGNYTIRINDREIEFSLAENEQKTFKRQ